MSTNQSTAVTVVDRVLQTLKTPTMRDQIKKALPPDVSFDRFERVTLTALQIDPSIIEECETQSVYNAIVRAAQDGLLPDKREGALVAFRVNVGDKDHPKWVKRAQWMPMVYGVIQMLGKAGITATAACVYEGEQIEVWTDDDGQHIKHRRDPFAETRKMIGVYALAKTADGNCYVEPMNIADIDAVRARSKNPDSGPWRDSYDRMAQKSALHRVAKRVPIQREEDRERLDRVLKSDEETFEQPEPRQATPTTASVEPQQAPKETPKALAGAVAGKKSTPAPAQKVEAAKETVVVQQKPAAPENEADMI